MNPFINRAVKTACAVLGALILTQCMSDAPPRAGTLRQVDPLAQKYLAQARQEEKNNRPKKAIKRYDDIVDDCPLSVEAPYALFRMGQLREQLGDPMDAFDHYQFLIERYPDSAYYKPALTRQKEMAFAAATGNMKNKVFGLFNVSMDPSVVTKWLNHITDNAPYSNDAPEAKKILGDYHAKRDQIPEAIAAYQSVVDNYGNSPFAPGAQLRVAELYADSPMTGGLSFSNIARAQEAYEEFLQRYPNSSQAPKARQSLARVRQHMVQRKLEIGEYYLNRMKDTSAAIFCFREVVAAEKTNPKAAVKAREYLRKLNVSVKAA